MNWLMMSIFITMLEQALTKQSKRVNQTINYKHQEIALKAEIFRFIDCEEKYQTYIKMMFTSFLAPETLKVEITFFRRTVNCFFFQNLNVQ